MSVDGRVVSWQSRSAELDDFGLLQKPRATINRLCHAYSLPLLDTGFALRHTSRPNKARDMFSDAYNALFQYFQGRFIPKQTPRYKRCGRLGILGLVMMQSPHKTL